MGSVLQKLGLGRMSKGEYEANLTGMNTFFGAVLGFILTGTEKLSSWEFGFVLMSVAATVISILFISGSRHRVTYAIYALALSFALPGVVDAVLKGQDILGDKVSPTLVVWTVMTIMVEFWSRDKPDPEE